MARVKLDEIVGPADPLAECEACDAGKMPFVEIGSVERDGLAVILCKPCASKFARMVFDELAE